MIQSNKQFLSLKHFGNSNKIESPLAKVLIYFSFAVLPLVLLCFLFVLFGGFKSYHPSNADELSYWRELYNEFASNQMVTGYNNYVGYYSQLGNFSYHGISPTSLWFMPGLIFGWHTWSIPVYNAMIVSVCFLLFLLLAKPNVKNVLSLSFIYILLNISWLYGLSSMMEIPGYGIVLLLTGALLYRFRNNTIQADVFLFIIYVLSGFYRILFFIYFFPIAITILIRTKKNIIKCCLISLYIVASLIIYYISKLTTPAYPYGFMYKLGRINGTGNKIIFILKHALTNLKLWFDPSQEAVVLVLSRYAYLIFLGFLLVILLLQIKRHHKLDESFCFEIYATIIMCISWVLQILFYDVFDWRDYRVLYQVAWFAIIIICVFRQNIFKKTYCAFIIYSIIQVTTLLLATSNNSFIVPINENESFNALKEITYNKNASSRWDNTLYIDIAIAPYPAFYIFPEQGIGVSWGITEGNESFISTIMPGYIISKNTISISGYEYKTSINDMFLYVLSQQE